MSATMMFDDLERSADRTLAVALWARHVRSMINCVPSFAVLHVALRGLLRSVCSGDRLGSLTEPQVLELAGRLRDLHAQLTFVLEHPGMGSLRKRPFFPRLINLLEEDTEDLYDVIENLTLASNDQFRRLISDSVQHISSVEDPEPVGRL